MATEVTTTVKSSGGDYTSLSAWDAGEQRDLVTADEIAIVECYNDWPSGLTDSCTVDGWTTGVDNYIVIKTPDAERHDGTPGSGFWFKTAVAWARCLTVVEPYTQIIGLDMEKGNNGTNFDIKADYVTVEKSIIRNTGQYSNLVLNNYVDNCVIRNNLFLRGGGGFPCIELASYCPSNGFYNNTMAGTGSGIGMNFGASSNYSSNVVTNNVTYNLATDYILRSNTTHSHNATSKANDSGSGLFGSTGAVFGITSDDFTDAANDDYSLPSDSDLVEAGITVSGFADDILGNARS